MLGWGDKKKDEAALRNLPVSQVMQLKRERDTYLQAFQRWNTSFRPLLAESLKDYNTKATRSAALALEIRWECLNATLRVNHFLGEMDYDNVTDAFERVVSIGRELIACEEENSDPKYSSQGALILSLYSVALKCRDRKIRRAAIELLETKPRRESVIDSTFQAKLARLQMEIEEFGIGENEVIPEENRIRAIKSFADLQGRKGNMKYLKKDKETGEFGHHHIDFIY
jgi:hypothetical protein